MPTVGNWINKKLIQIGYLVITRITHAGLLEMIAHVMLREGKNYPEQLILLMKEALLYMHL